MSARVTLLTDFGSADGYVAAMKGALLRHGATDLVDLAHDIEPGDVQAAAYVLLQAAPHFPADTVHLVVVDPGVGSERRALSVRMGTHGFVAPDNGVLTHLIDRAEDVSAVALGIGRVGASDPSPVFHGRDLFAPAAAQLALGRSLESLGVAVARDDLIRLPLVEPRWLEGGGWSGAVLHIDHFGNLITNIPVDSDIEWVGAQVRIGSETVPVVRTYSDRSDGELLALRGSSGQLEIAQNRGDAQRHLRSRRGDVVELSLPRRS